MKIINFIEKLFNKILPSPFSIGIFLTIVSIILSTFFYGGNSPLKTNFKLTIKNWENGMWDPPLLVFCFQMMLMLILGYSLAKCKLIEKLISKISIICNNNSSSCFYVCFFSILISYLNWGLGLIFGAIFVKKIGESATKKNILINYPLIGACGYSGLLVWHGGLSGSAPIKAAENNHLINIMSGVRDNYQIMNLPIKISLEDTIFSSMNIFVSILTLTIIPVSVYILSKYVKVKRYNFKNINEIEKKIEISNIHGFDNSRLISKIMGFLIICVSTYNSIDYVKINSLDFINPNFINFTLLGLCIFFHNNFYYFLKSIESGIKSCSGIIIQFPLYFGIMGIMKFSGLISLFSNFFVSVSSAFTFPFYTFLSAAIINIFIPSGGGQWAIQGPIIIETANQLNISISKCIMALAYGDQVSNMLQPFWALPLLGITGLKAKEILPYSLFLMIIGSMIFLLDLMIF
ncbi:MAG: short-chain fatty acid transporter [Flavobacteriales bacterium]|nr:short-chain fatty acid transporter [Flavobacteriales bacterium]